VFAAVGYGAGVALFIIFGIAAGFAGFGLWRVYIGLDSARFPMISFGDPFLRIYGPKYRHVINFMQALQQFLSVCVVVLGNSTLLGQIAQESICFIAVIIIVSYLETNGNLLGKLTDNIVRSCRSLSSASSPESSGLSSVSAGFVTSASG
jgi:amino acid permease